MQRKLSQFVLCAVLTVVGPALFAQSASLSVEKIGTPATVAPSADITYTITVSSEGPSDASNVSLDDTVPTNTTFQSLSSPGGWSCSTPAVGGVGAISCSNPTLAPGSAVFTLVVRVDVGVANGVIITNTATVSSTTADPDSGDNSSTATTDIVAVPPVVTLSIAIVDAPDPVTAGYDVTYTLTVSSTFVDALDAVLTAPTPPNTTFRSFVAPGGWSCAAPSIGAAGVVSCSSPTLAPGDTVFTLTVRVSAAALGGSTITDSASIEFESDGRTETASDSEETTVAAATLLSATKTFSGFRTPGSALTYTIVITNEGPGAQADNPGNELTDVLPAGLTLVSAAATSGTAIATIATNTVTWDGSLAAGASVTITIEASVGAGVAVGTIISNQAALSWDGEGDGANDVSGSSDDPATLPLNDPTSFAVASTIPVPATGPVGRAILVALLALLGTFALRRVS